jgi:hypothetical protein
MCPGISPTHALLGCSTLQHVLQLSPTGAEQVLCVLDLATPAQLLCSSYNTFMNPSCNMLALQDTGGFFIAVLEKVTPTPPLEDPKMGHRYARVGQETVVASCGPVTALCGHG